MSKGQHQEPVQTRGALLEGRREKNVLWTETAKRASCAEASLVADGSEPEDDKS